jgi:hypothetical protein
VKEVDPRGPAADDPRVHRDGKGRLHKTRGGRHYDHHRPSMHGAAADDGSIWEGGAAIFRVVVEAGPAAGDESSGQGPDRKDQR